MATDLITHHDQIISKRFAESIKASLNNKRRRYTIKYDGAGLMRSVGSYIPQCNIYINYNFGDISNSDDDQIFYIIDGALYVIIVRKSMCYILHNISNHTLEFEFDSALISVFKNEELLRGLLCNISNHVDNALRDYQEQYGIH